MDNNYTQFRSQGIRESAKVEGIDTLFAVDETANFAAITHWQNDPGKHDVPPLVDIFISIPEKQTGTVLTRYFGSKRSGVTDPNTNGGFFRPHDYDVAWESHEVSRSWGVFLNPSYVHRYAEEHDLTFNINLLSDNWNCDADLFTQLAREVRSLGAAGQNSAHFREQVTNLASMLIIEQAQGLSMPAKQSLSVSNNAITKVIDYLEANLCRDLSLLELSQVAGLSRFQVSRHFTKTYGESFKRYHNRRRCEESLSLLDDSQMSIAEIAIKLGFANQSHFINVFKSRFRVTPGQYRQERHDYLHKKR